jgi:hypothetical protein
MVKVNNCTYKWRKFAQSGHPEPYICKLCKDVFAGRQAVQKFQPENFSPTVSREIRRRKTLNQWLNHWLSENQELHSTKKTFFFWRGFERQTLDNVFQQLVWATGGSEAVKNNTTLQCWWWTAVNYFLFHGQTTYLAAHVYIGSRKNATSCYCHTMPTLGNFYIRNCTQSNFFTRH